MPKSLEDVIIWDMATATFDTHKFIKNLQAKGISEEQSEAIVETVVGIQQAANENFSPKAEVNLFKSELKHDISLVDKGLKHEIKAVEQGLRSEIKALDQNLRGEIKAVEQKLDAKINSVEQSLRAEINLLKWMVGTVIVGVLTLLAKAFF